MQVKGPAAETASRGGSRGGFDRRILFGIAFICLAGLLFPVMGGFAKILGGEFSTLQVSWARAFGHIVFMLALFLPQKGVKVLRTRRPGLHLLRSALLFSSNLCYFLAITFIPIADAASISLTTPLLVALLAWPMLGERTTLARGIAMAVGFGGVLIVIRPGSEVFQPATLLVLWSATAYGIYQILTRRVSNTDSPETSTIYSSVVGAVFMLLAMPFVWRTPQTWAEVAMFCSIGILGGLGHYCVARALTLAPANIVSPFQYFQLIGSVLIGWSFFGDLPDAWSWLGTAVIVGSGLFIGWTQARRSARLATEPVRRLS